VTERPAFFFRMVLAPSAAASPLRAPMSNDRNARLNPLPTLIFSSRWLQLPLYLGLIIAQVGIHLTFLLSALCIAAADRLMPHAAHMPAKLKNDHL